MFGWASSLRLSTAVLTSAPQRLLSRSIRTAPERSAKLAAKPDPAAKILARTAETDNRWFGLQVKPMPQASLANNGAWFAPSKHPFFRTEAFSVVLKPFPRNLCDEKGRLDEWKLVPSWLPMPPHPSTHQRRYLRPPFYPPPGELTPRSTAREGDGKWEAASVPVASAAAVRPMVRVLVLSTKRRVHAFAVIRHRVRTRLVEALRLAMVQLQHEGADIGRMLDPTRNVLVVYAEAPAHNKDMAQLARDMTHGLKNLAARAADGRENRPKRRVEKPRRKMADGG